LHLGLVELGSADSWIQLYIDSSGGWREPFCTRSFPVKSEGVRAVAIDHDRVFSGGYDATLFTYSRNRDEMVASRKVGSAIHAITVDAASESVFVMQRSDELLRMYSRPPVMLPFIRI
jgi:hypothetical protein